MRVLRTEEEIMSTWQGGVNKPLVSICCITYNHELYIEDALEGFLIQETDFPFEILIHDDASSDKTADIIRQYEAKYPKLIKPIYQTENQYSQGKRITPILMGIANGDYLAFCEGDDFWTDNQKLQYQIEKMQEYSECHLSFHPTKILNDQTMTGTILRKHAEQDKVFSVKEVIEGDGGFCPTASLIIKKEAIENLPAFFANAPVGDYFLQILGSVHGGALYIDKIMSAYRIHPNGAWTSLTNNFEPLKNFAINFSKTLQEMDEFFNFQYHKEIRLVMSNHFLAIINNIEFSLKDRIDFYNNYKHYLSIEQQLNHQQALIDEQTNMMKMIKDKEDHIRNLESQINHQGDKIKKLKDELHLLYTSKSWKYTTLLRKLKTSMWTKK